MDADRLTKTVDLSKMALILAGACSLFEIEPVLNCFNELMFLCRFLVMPAFLRSVIQGFGHSYYRFRFLRCCMYLLVIVALAG